MTSAGATDAGTTSARVRLTRARPTRARPTRARTARARPGRARPTPRPARARPLPWSAAGSRSRAATPRRPPPTPGRPTPAGPTCPRSRSRPVGRSSSLRTRTTSRSPSASSPRLAARGSPPEVVVLTDGAASHPGSPTHAPAALVERRAAEVQAAVAILSPASPVTLLGHPDGGLREVRDAVRDDLRRVLGTDSVDTLVVPWRGDGHRDHRVAGEIRALAAGTPARASSSTRCGCGSGRRPT